MSRARLLGAGLPLRPDRPVDLVVNNDRNEIGGALSYYYNRHNLKIQADYRADQGRCRQRRRGTTTKEFRLQTQFIF